MADEEEDEGPAVELGEGPAVEGAPLARIASRLTWPVEKELIRRREGGAVVRTPEGPRSLDAILDETDETYFDTQHGFLREVRAVIGTGPVATEDA